MGILCLTSHNLYIPYLRFKRHINLYVNRGAKATVYEGGVRVPAFIYGPKDYFPESFDYRGLFHVSDFYPTIMNIIGRADIMKDKRREAIDGISQYSRLQGNTSVNPRKAVHINR